MIAKAFGNYAFGYDIKGRTLSANSRSQVGDPTETRRGPTIAARRNPTGPYAGPVAPVVNHVAPAAAVVGHAASYTAPLAIAAPLAAPLAVAAPVAYGGVIGHGAPLHLLVLHTEPTLVWDMA
ncbi:hypothetical protein TNIN_458121 [Trichonephila inaurata madagascariensis]|uniref:Uncharacterized protein n=1 Tax=Trichonephila inaurata madagascariensis TaxID=2747483 RepID=A0A8X7CB03_9ARAC|nr:hypothetical protein TNIN_458121 [Trichonephila inaurata madagascariensis]